MLCTKPYYVVQAILTFPCFVLITCLWAYLWILCPAALVSKHPSLALLKLLLATRNLSPLSFQNKQRGAPCEVKRWAMMTWLPFFFSLCKSTVPWHTFSSAVTSCTCKITCLPLCLSFSIPLLQSTVNLPWGERPIARPAYFLRSGNPLWDKKSLNSLFPKKYSISSL